jgi:ADP-ribose pyrophosphatase
MYQKVSSRIAYNAKVISVREDTVLSTDGKTEVFEVLHLPEGVFILPLLENGNILLLKEYRHNHGWIYSIPMGGREPSDLDPLQAARRELLEEVNLIAEDWIHLSTHHNGIYEEGLHHFFIATKLSPGDILPIRDELIDQVEISFEDAFTSMDEGKIVEISSRACIWAAYIYIRRQHSLLTSSRQESRRDV